MERTRTTRHIKQRDEINWGTFEQPRYVP